MSAFIESIECILDDEIKKAYRLGYRQGTLDSMKKSKLLSPESEMMCVGEVLLPDYIGKYPITRKEWFEIYPKKDDGKGKLLRPITHVSWYDAIRYCNARSLKEGLTPCYDHVVSSETDDDSPYRSQVTCNFKANGYRLPTEDEWEYAARGGAKGLEDNFLYSGSNDPDEVAWYDENSKGRVHRVGKKKPNQLGLYDMSGNVWEWCWNQFVQNDCARVLRGGSYDFDAFLLLSAFRFSYVPGNYNYIVGFRVVRNTKKI